MTCSAAARRPIRVAGAALLGQAANILNATTYSLLNAVGRSQDASLAVLQAVTVYWALPLVLLGVVLWC